MKNSQIFALIDADNFYVRCHEIFRPDLEQKAVVVVGPNDANVVARSHRAKCMGVNMSAPLFLWREEIERGDLVVLSSTMPLYADLSLRLGELLNLFGPCEPFSIDEYFVHFSGAADWYALGLKLRAMIERRLGLKVAVGFGPTKLLAKLANRLAKRGEEGVVDLASDPSKRDRLLAQLPIEIVCGIGSRSSRRLHQSGIFTVRQFIHLSDPFIKQLLSKRGVDVAWELRGYPVSELQMTPRKPHSIGRSRAFARAVSTLEELLEALTIYVSRAAEKLRRFGLAASSVCVSLETNPFRKQEPAYANVAVYRLSVPTNGTLTLMETASRTLKKIFRPGFAYHRVGVFLQELVPAQPQQQSWLRDGKLEAKQWRVMRVIDAINDRFGRDTIFLGAAGLVRRWQKPSAYPTGRYTTCWQEIALVYAR